MIIRKLVIILITISALAAGSFAESAKLSKRLQELEDSTSKTLGENCETSEIIQQKKDQLELIALKIFAVNSREVSMCDFRLAGPSQAEKLIKTAEPLARELENYLTKLDEDILSARVHERYAILGLPQKLEKLKTPTMVQLAKTKLLLGKCWQLTDSENKETYVKNNCAETINLIAKLKGSLDSSNAKQAAFAATFAQSMIDFSSASKSMAAIASSSDFSTRQKMLCSFELSWRHAENNDHEKAKLWQGQFESITNNISVKSGKISLDIYKALLREQVYYKKAEFLQLTGGKAPSHDEKLAADALERLFIENKKSRAALARILKNSFSSETRYGRRYPALLFSRGFIAASEGAIPQAQFWLEKCGESFIKSDFFYRESVWKLNELFSQAAYTVEDRDQRDEINRKTLQYQEIFVSRWPEDTRSLMAAENLANFAGIKDYGSEDHIAKLQRAARIAGLHKSRQGSVNLTIQFHLKIADAQYCSPYKNLSQAKKTLENIIEQSNENQYGHYLAKAKLSKVNAMITAIAGDSAKAKSFAEKLEKFSEGKNDMLIRLTLGELFIDALNDSENALRILDTASPEIFSLPKCSWVRPVEMRVYIKLKSLMQKHDFAGAVYFISNNHRLTWRIQDLKNTLVDQMLHLVMLDLASGENKHAEKTQTLAKLAESLLGNDIFLRPAKNTDFKSKLLTAKALHLCDKGLFDQATKNAILAANCEKPSEMADLAQARILWASGNWAQAAKNLHKLLPEDGLASEKYNDKQTWLTEALLGRCIYENTAPESTERRRLSLRLRQLQLKDANFGGLKDIFASMMD